MTPDTALELSVEQLIAVLNKKFSMECTKLQSTMPPMATLVAEIGALEKRAKEFLHRVACLRNPLRPVNRLPPEIVALCAAFVPRTDPKPIVSLTHVCRYWREAIISNPSSWTLIGSGWKPLVPLCLERAGAAPLTVDISMEDVKQGEDLIEVLLPHVSRISNLSLACSSSFKNAANILTSPTLNLTSLRLQSQHRARIHLYPLLSNIKSLMELKLIGYKFSLKKLITFLKSNPNLEILDLDVLFTTTRVLTAHERWVSLPRLRRLALTCDTAIDARALLSSLSLPRGINIEVRGSLRNSSGDLTSFLPCPPTPILDLLAPITTVKYFRYKGQLHLSGNDGSFSFYSHRSPQNLYEEFDLFATGAVREFHLHFYFGDPLSLLLERLPALEALVICQTNCSLNISVLAEEPVLCPSLKTIVFLDCWEIPIDELKGASAKREQSIAARLHRVVFANHTRAFPKPELVTRLRMIVPRVDVVVGDELPDLL